MLNSGNKLTVTYYGEITIEPILTPEFDVDHDFEVKNGVFSVTIPEISRDFRRDESKVSEHALVDNTPLDT